VKGHITSAIWHCDSTPNITYPTLASWLILKSDLTMHRKYSRMFLVRYLSELMLFKAQN